MDPQTIWIIVLSISTPIAGVVGFAIQIRAVQKGRLENEKLQLEVKALKAKAGEAERRIVQVTTGEVQRFAMKDNILYCKSPRESYNVEQPTLSTRTSLKEFVMVGAVILGLLLIAGYFLYDLYRLVAWLGTKL
ncbi:MAG: hypothetical protein WAW02_14445 [Sideroxyarcus sp.]